MAGKLVDKLRIKEGMTLLTVNSPSNFKEGLGAIPENVKISTTAKKQNQIHWFVKNKAVLEKEFDKVFGLIKDNIVCWIYYPKGTSKIQTDLTRDKGWELIVKNPEIQWLSLISFDDTWSTFAIRRKKEDDKKKEAKPQERPIFDYIDSKTKTIRLPEDLEKLLKKNKKASIYFDSLSFSNRKEYVEWIITAKREETRNERLKETIERLEKNWKNPRNI